jgi:hypothetical protein
MSWRGAIGLNETDLNDLRYLVPGYQVSSSAWFFIAAHHLSDLLHAAESSRQPRRSRQVTPAGFSARTASCLPDRPARGNKRTH